MIDLIDHRFSPSPVFDYLPSLTSKLLFLSQKTGKEKHFMTEGICNKYIED